MGDTILKDHHSNPKTSGKMRHNNAKNKLWCCLYSGEKSHAANGVRVPLLVINTVKRKRWRVLEVIGGLD